MDYVFLDFCINRLGLSHRSFFTPRVRGWNVSPTAPVCNIVSLPPSRPSPLPPSLPSKLGWAAMASTIMEQMATDGVPVTPHTYGTAVKVRGTLLYLHSESCKSLYAHPSFNLGFVWGLFGRDVCIPR